MCLGEWLKERVALRRHNHHCWFILFEVRAEVRATDSEIETYRIICEFWAEAEEKVDIKQIVKHNSNTQQPSN
jgi:hypothetical protein